MAAATFVLFITACGGGDKGGSPQTATAKPTVSACTAIDSTPVALAVRAYIKESAPAPQFFLNAVGTDSALPDDGMRVLQDKGPTYFYAGDAAALKKVRDKLENNGPYATLLVVFRGKTTTADGNAVVKLAGHYVGGEHDGKAGAERSYTVVCSAETWKLAPAGNSP